VTNKETKTNGREERDEMFSLMKKIWVEERPHDLWKRSLSNLAPLVKQLVESQKSEQKAPMANRADQIDKRAFQAAVRTNQEDYSTIAEAVRDLQDKPQFKRYREKTLRKWARPVWTKPIQVGRPPKKTS